MRENQDHSVLTLWGGRAERYREFPHTEIRAHDTFGVQPIRFGHAYHYEAWVLTRFDPDTKSITQKPTKVAAVINGVERQATVTFVVTRRDDSVDYVLATKDAALPSEYRSVRRIAAANRARVVHLTREDVRARVDEFWWFERLRQVATMWVRMGAEHDEALVSLVAGGRKTLTEFCAQIDAPRDLLRARLARLHIAGRVVIDRNDGQLAASIAAGAAP